jgi:hypothetical protein
MRQLFLAIAIVIPVSAMAQDPVGPAYAAAKKQELLRLQAHNALARQVAPVGPNYAAASQMRLRNLQKNARSRETTQVGLVYAARVASYKANQRLANGTWVNNSYLFSRRTIRIRPGTRNTPVFRGLSDPWMWFSQQVWGYWQWRY